MSTAPALAFSTANCQVAGALEVIGETGTMLVLREVFNGVRRFDDMRRHSGLSRQVLSNRLATLVEHGVLRRVPYRDEGARVRHEYRLTPKGFDLYPVLAALAQWGERYVAGPEGVPVELEHRGCGAVVRPVLVCDEGHRLDDLRQVATRPGPGVRPFAEA
ncbi:winged helix-turn-helix transcriptional regulator [Nocardioides marmoribigeumensis]|jgi:DNA-binding HxlR family transcriptional regulator|uniref:DNA-binding HxlR family transcriptional regulator n=1 Tax=Nocardioides marmoribigeumensis TaxID=433649 RepID=A0ABU2BV89_9ACTN|nr:helix-turn-helix domain-containing protein [Nocardioides marmoribigeumensis]MDR7362555.1 DNA-binding HxlR family transcriptional regulator [Nocardioides marmoribigeumensis]